MPRVWWVVAAVLLAVAAVCGAARLWSTDLQVLVVVAALAPVAVLVGVAGLLVAVAARAWVLVVVGGVVVALLVVAQLPLLPTRAGAAPRADDVVVATVNLGLGEASASAVVEEVRTHGVDVLGVQELTPAALTALTSAGLRSALPYVLASPGPDATGVGLWSRWPLADPQEIWGLTMHRVRADVDLGPAGRTRVLVVHVPAPWPGSPSVWRSELAGLADAAHDTAGPLVVLGDLNATTDHAPFRAVLERGLGDAAQGFGWLPTYPAGTRLPAVLALDHVLVRDLTPVAATTFDVSGTDHRGLLARLRRGPTVAVPSSSASIGLDP